MLSKIERWGIVLLLAALILLHVFDLKLRKASAGFHLSDTITTHHTEYRYDTADHQLSGNTILVIHDTLLLPNQIDTAQVIREYFSRNIYQSEYHDTNIMATIIDTIQENKLAGRSFTYHMLRPTQIVNTTNQIINQVNRPRFYAGLDIGVYPKVSARVQGFYAGNKIGVSMATGLIAGQPNVSAGLYLPIKKW